MSPEEWYTGMRNEADWSNDERWAAETRTAARMQQYVHDIAPLAILTVVSSSITWLVTIRHNVVVTYERGFRDVVVHPSNFSQSDFYADVGVSTVTALIVLALLIGLISGRQNKPLWVPFALSLGVPLGVQIAENVATYSFDLVTYSLLDESMWPVIVVGFVLTGWYLGQRWASTRSFPGSRRQ